MHKTAKPRIASYAYIDNDIILQPSRYQSSTPLYVVSISIVNCVYCDHISEPISSTSNRRYLFQVVGQLNAVYVIEGGHVFDGT
jgi:hypothetical protein